MQFDLSAALEVASPIGTGAWGDEMLSFRANGRDQVKKYLGLAPPACNTCCADTPSLAGGRGLLVFLARLGLVQLGERVGGTGDVVLVGVIVDGRRRVRVIGMGDLWLVLGHGGSRYLARLLGEAWSECRAAGTRT